MNTKAIAKCYVTKIESSKRRGKEFNLSFTTFANIKQQTHCEYSGLPFDDNENTLSFERIDNAIGYIDGNVIPVTRKLNTLRNDKTLEDCIEALRKLESKEGQKYNYSTFSIYKFANSRSQKPKLRGKRMHSYFNQVKTLEQIYNKIQGQNVHFSAAITAIANNGNDPTDQINQHVKVGIKNKKAFGIKLNQLNMWLDKQPRKDLKTRMNYTYKLSETHHKVTRKLNEKVKEEDIQNMRYLVNGLTKFKNLSKSQKYAVKLGLPTNTSKAKLLKHKIVYNFINRV